MVLPSGIPARRLASAEADTHEADSSFLRAIERWENRPHNRPGSDKTWVERLIEDARQHYQSAVRVR